MNSAFIIDRGEDLTHFLPPPDVVLLADCIYYEQVCFDSG